MGYPHDDGNPRNIISARMAEAGVMALVASVLAGWVSWQVLGERLDHLKARVDRLETAVVEVRDAVRRLEGAGARRNLLLRELVPERPARAAADRRGDG